MGDGPDESYHVHWTGCAQDDNRCCSRRGSRSGEVRQLYVPQSRRSIAQDGRATGTTRRSVELLLRSRTLWLWPSPIPARLGHACAVVVSPITVVEGGDGAAWSRIAMAIFGALSKRERRSSASLPARGNATLPRQRCAAAGLHAIRSSHAEEERRHDCYRGPPLRAAQPLPASRTHRGPLRRLGPRPRPPRRTSAPARVLPRLYPRTRPRTPVACGARSRRSHPSPPMRRRRPASRRCSRG